MKEVSLMASRTKYHIGFRALRMALRMNQSEFAKYIGKTKSFISYIEHGKRQPSLETLNFIREKTGLQKRDLWQLMTDPLAFRRNNNTTDLSMRIKGALAFLV